MIKPTNKKIQKLKYLGSDILVALISWCFFFSFRKLQEDFSYKELSNIVLSDTNFYLGLIVLPILWLCLHSINGYYKNVYKKSAIQDITKSFYISLIGCIILLFTIILDDYITDYKEYYTYFIVLFTSYFIPLTFFRLYITNSTNRKIRKRLIGFNTIIIGSGKIAFSIYNELEKEKSSSGNLFLGYVEPNYDSPTNEKIQLKCLGNIKDISNIIEKLGVEEVIIALEKEESQLLNDIMAELLAKQISIKISADEKSILLGEINNFTLSSQAFISIAFNKMACWQRVIKRSFELGFCILGGIFISPILIYAAIKVRRSSPGPIIYKQERIGLHGKPFNMYKFRSMYIDAEKDTPLLTNDDDNRITPFGKIMRKYRIDEFPQFLNVIKGDMSLVGPRPERDFFIQQIVKVAPQYRLLFNVKPGITSWGEVKYGYAENISQMIKRLKYDLIYLNNLSLSTDFKILFYTISTVFRGEGK